MAAPAVADADPSAAPISYTADSELARCASSAPSVVIEGLQTQIASMKQVLKQAQKKKKLDS